MKKNAAFIILTAIVLLVPILGGCGNFGIGGGGGDVTAAVLIHAITLYSNGQESNYVDSYAASQSQITFADPKYLEFPNGTQINYSILTGGQTTNNYFYGNSQNNFGSIVIPFYESQQRQLRIETTYNEPINGTYTAKLGSSSRDINMETQNYLNAINPADVATGAGGSLINVTAGDLITIYNQNSSDLRYLCQIYDTNLGNSVVDKYWASTDVRQILWTDVENLNDFFTYSTVAPANGMVQFTLPGSILNTGNNNLYLVVTAYDVAGMNIQTDENLTSFTQAYSEIRMYYSGI